MTNAHVALLRGINVGGRNKITNAYFDSRLGTTSTARNWKTVLKLHELLVSLGSS